MRGSSALRGRKKDHQPRQTFKAAPTRQTAEAQTKLSHTPVLRRLNCRRSADWFLSDNLFLGLWAKPAVVAHRDTSTGFVAAPTHSWLGCPPSPPTVADTHTHTHGVKEGYEVYTTCTCGAAGPAEPRSLPTVLCCPPIEQHLNFSRRLGLCLFLLFVLFLSASSSAFNRLL